MLRQDGGADALEEERRLFYVGATRARKKLHIFNARIRTRFGVRDACIPSRFLDEIDTEALEYEAGASPRRASFSSGDADENAPRPGGTFRNTMRRPAFPPGALRSATSDRPTFGGGTTIRVGSGGPSLGITNAPVPSQMPPKKTFPDYESEDQSSGGSFKVGMRVSHPKFGTGKVTKIHGSGNAARLDVQFGTQTKRLVAGFAGLSILG